MKVRLTQQARRDRHLIHEYVAGHSPSGARNVMRDIAAKLDFIAQFPEGAPATDEPGIRMAALRRYPYVLFYRVLADHVAVLHIRHTSRKRWEGPSS